MQLTGISAVVTGAASGLGAATALALARRGIAVVGIDLPSGIERAEAAGGVQLVAGDVTSETEVAAALDAVPADKPLRIVVNCAGVAPSRRLVSSRGTHDLELFRRTIEINLIGTFNVLRLAAERMARGEPDSEGQRGLIVNTASIAAFEGQIGQAAYAASKGGVVALGLASARDLARNGIRVNTIAPGVVDTPMVASFSDEVRASLSAEVPFPSRLARTEEFARLVVTIAEIDYLNGETIRMDGALRMGPQ